MTSSFIPFLKEKTRASRPYAFLIQGGTIKLSSERKQHYSIILKNLLKKINSGKLIM